MIRFIIFLILAYLFYRVVKGVFTPGRPAVKGQKQGEVIDQMVQDLTCQTYIPRMGAVKRRLGGQEYYFCSSECAEKFESETKNNV